MNWQNTYKEKLVSVEEAAGVVKSGDRIWLPGATSLPVDIMKKVDARRDQLHGVKVVSGLMFHPFEFLKGDTRNNIQYYSSFLGPVERAMYAEGNINFIVNQFSQLAQVIQEKHPCNLVIFECSEPDENGYMSYGPAGSLVNAKAKDLAETIVVQVNKKTPYVYGCDAHIHISEVDYICEQSRDLVEVSSSVTDEDDSKIAAFIVDKVEDGSTIQLGIGSISDAIGKFLGGKWDLGIHTEIFTNSMVELAKRGVINNNKKNIHQGKSVIVTAIGDKHLHQFIDKNDSIEARAAAYVNDPNIIRQHDKFISINSTIEVDLTGQVCSETIGFRQFSGTGGQLDFVRGARYSKDGKSFIALKSTAMTKKGLVSKISCSLQPGTVVTVPRTEVQYIVTEYGIVNLWGEDIQSRVKAMISIAHPDFRGKLTSEAVEAGLLLL
jgi:4-hydroxybutyrate CoA-transferase